MNDGYKRGDVGLVISRTKGEDGTVTLVSMTERRWPP
jgi:hypothetical protein